MKNFKMLCLLFFAGYARAGGPVAPEGWEGSFDAELPNGESCCLLADLNQSGLTGGAFVLISSDRSEFGLFALTYAPDAKEHWQLLEKHPMASLKSYRFSIAPPIGSLSVGIEACLAPHACKRYSSPFAGLPLELVKK
ncbi:MAG: hypothetical protein QM761_13070 [Pseudoxanthomonas sp.]